MNTAATPSKCARAVCVSGAIALAGLVTGCATVIGGHPEPILDDQEQLAALAPVMSASAATNCVSKPSEICRNQVVGARMQAADLRFAAFERAMFSQDRQLGFGTSVASSILSAGATATTGDVARTLSALTSVLLGTKTAYDKELLAERTAVAIHTAMRARRAQVGLRLRKGLVKSHADYPVVVALADVNEYIEAGSVLGALVGITESVGQEARKTQDELRDLTIRGDFSKDGDYWSRLLCGTAACALADEKLRSRVEACLKDSGIKDMPAGPSIALMGGKIAMTGEQRDVLDKCLRNSAAQATSSATK